MTTELFDRKAIIHFFNAHNQTVGICFLVDIEEKLDFYHLLWFVVW